MRQRRVALKGSVYVAVEPTTSAYIAVRGAKPRLTTKLHLATICPATPACRAELASLLNARLDGIPHELVRVDRL